MQQALLTQFMSPTPSQQSLYVPHDSPMRRHCGVAVHDFGPASTPAAKSQ